jgi:hypothetical protein
LLDSELRCVDTKASVLMCVTVAVVVQVTYVARTDPKGWIPEAILRYVAEQTPLCVPRVVQYARTHGPPPFPALLAGSLLSVPDYAHATGEYVIDLRLRPPPRARTRGTNKQEEDDDDDGEGAAAGPAFTEFFVGRRRFPQGADVTVLPAAAAVRLDGYVSDYAGVEGCVVRLTVAEAPAEGLVVRVRMLPRAGAGASTPTLVFNGRPAPTPLPPLTYPGDQPAPTAATASVSVPVPVPAAVPVPVPVPVSVPVPVPVSGAGAQGPPLRPEWNLTTDPARDEHAARTQELFALSERVFADAAQGICVSVCV